MRPQGRGSMDHLLPKRVCQRLFNIYYPSDPVVSFLFIGIGQVKAKTVEPFLEDISFKMFHNRKQLDEHDENIIMENTVK